MNDHSIDRLAELLDRPGPVALTDDDRSLIRAALASLASSERRVGHLRRVLSVHRDALAQAEAAAAAATREIAETAGAGPVYDFAAADAARAAFETKLTSARSTAEIVAAALRFARDAATLAG